VLLFFFLLEKEPRAVVTLGTAGLRACAQACDGRPLGLGVEAGVLLWLIFLLEDGEATRGDLEFNVVGGGNSAGENAPRWVALKKRAL
jgi:hypothetical protein